MKQVFTPKKMRPSAQTIYFIKQIARVSSSMFSFLIMF